MVLHILSKGIFMSEKRIKIAVVRARVTSELDKALRLYCEKNNITITHIIESLLKDFLDKEGMLK